MNLKLFNELMRKSPSQKRPEWLMFLEICEIYLKKHEIKNPIVVELGIWRNRQERFYEQLLGAWHISIDISRRRNDPDILGDTHDPKTMEALKERLGGKSINILFVDASHCYESVKKDFELYSPLCTDVVAFHDINTNRYEKTKKREVWRFWDELKASAYAGKEECKDFLFLSICQHRRGVGDRGQMGIGVIIKK